LAGSAQIDALFGSSLIICGVSRGGTDWIGELAGDEKRVYEEQSSNADTTLGQCATRPVLAF
jgi:hypothetical protein